jgi:hypothetical protein
MWQLLDPGRARNAGSKAVSPFALTTVNIVNIRSFVLLLFWKNKCDTTLSSRGDARLPIDERTGKWQRN